MNHRLKLLALATVALVFATDQALSQTRVLYIPADSVSAGGKSLAAITDVCTAGNTLCYNATTKPVPPSGAPVVRSWTTYFPGQSKCFSTYWGRPGNCFYIRSDGHAMGPYGSFTDGGFGGSSIQQDVPQSAARDLGFPYGNQALAVTAGQIIASSSGNGPTTTTITGSYLAPIGVDAFGSTPTDFTLIPATSTMTTVTCSGMYC